MPYNYGPITILPDIPGQGGGGFFVGDQRLGYGDPRIWGSSGQFLGGPGWRDPNQSDSGGSGEELSDAQRAYRDWSARTGLTQIHQAELGGYAGVRDPSALQWDPTYGLVTRGDNLTEQDGSNRSWMTAALMAGGLGAAGAHSAATGGAAKGGSGGYMDAIGNAAEGANAGASLTGPVSAAGGLNLGEPIPHLTPTTIPDLQSTGLLGRIEAALANPGQALGSLGTSILNNPLQAAGLVQAGAGLLGGGSSGEPAATPKGGGGDLALNLQRPQYTPNPYTQAQLRQLYGG